MIRTFAPALLALAAVLAPADAAAQPPACTGDTSARGVVKRPGPRLEFGVMPRVETGQIGPRPAPAVPEEPTRTLAAMERLRPPNGPFTARLNRFFWSDGEPAFRRYLALARRYTSRGYRVELQVRYHPSAAQEGDIGAWVRHVRETVRRFGPDPGVRALQIANEVNFTFSEDSSDGAFREARQALVSGVIAAKDEARRRGFDQLRIGFNWAYRLDPASETSFWSSLRDRGGPRFVRSLDYMGLDAYPGTIFPPSEPTLEDYRDGMVNAMSAMRCYATIPGIPRSVPIEVGENGWPTTPGRSYARQRDVLRAMVGAVHDFRGTYNVHGYRWFNLRDADTSSPQVFQRAGLLEDDYDPKPAFAEYARLVRSLSVRFGPRSRSRLRLRLRYRRGRLRASRRRCARGRVRAVVSGRDRHLARRVAFYRSGRRRRVAYDRSRPLSRVVDRRHHRGRTHLHTVRAKVRLRGGRLLRLRSRYRVCARSRLQRR